jgi:hypothetical protein
VPPVDQHGQLDRAWTADVVERVQGRPHRPPAVQHVVDENDDGVVDTASGDRRGLQWPRRPQPQVVAVHGDVEGPGRDGTALDRGHGGGYPRGQRDAPGGDAEEHHTLVALVALEDLMRDAGEGTRNRIGIEHDTRYFCSELATVCSRRHRFNPFSASRDGP